MKLLGYRHQRTLARPAEVRGFGLLTGAEVRLRFRPAGPDCGVTFVRTDLPSAPRIPARVQSVTGTQRRTTLGEAPAQVALVEHVLAALAGLKIDNCTVEINACEPPGSVVIVLTVFASVVLVVLLISRSGPESISFVPSGRVTSVHV